jgi:hypothetical protein
VPVELRRDRATLDRGADGNQGPGQDAHAMGPGDDHPRRPVPALQMADRMIIFRLMAKHVARTLGCFASFMPKPFQASFGSGAHLNVSLADLETGRNLFEGSSGWESGSGPVEHSQAYSTLAYQFTSGVLAPVPRSWPCCPRPSTRISA